MNNRELLDSAVTFARKLFDAHGELTATFIAVGADGSVTLIQAPWRNEAEKADMLVGVRAQFAELGIVRYVLASEVWMVNRRRGEWDGSRQPSQCDDRVEMVHFTAVDGEGCLTEAYEIERPFDGSPPKMGKKHDMSGEIVTGRMLKLLTPPGPGETTSAVVVEICCNFFHGGIWWWEEKTTTRERHGHEYERVSS